MSLISMEFLLFVLAAAVGYYLIPKKYQWLWLLVFSYIYYASSGVRLLVFLVYTTGTTYVAGRFLEKVEQKELPKKEAKAAKRRILTIGLLLNFGMLAVLKYTNFAVANVNAIFHTSFSFQKWMLPLGISFYTFQTLSYTIDVYRGDTKAQKSLVSFGTYVSFFPQLIAGPIVRYSDVENQIASCLLYTSPSPRD